ncbi:MAG TPA: DegT/DnrJ/EryC1/StrS family aminotransferase [Thermoanaerobaculia bacterium]|nr:DegT/DnrJ/EryC1/StrS family aminotransferase [Thermoanaerobaculia bacterium]
MAVPLLDLKLQYATIRDEVLRVTEEVYESQYFILGKRVEEFEKHFAAYCGTKHAIGVSSGTDALLIALMVLGVGPGDEVIVPAYSFFATAGVVTRLGATPVFVDVSLDDYNIDVAQIKNKITKKTKAIMPVHLFGQCADMSRMDFGIPIVEDAAQAVGAEFDGKRAGSMGAIGCFSFFPSKNLGAFGDAGAVTTNDDALAEKLLDFRVHGMRPKYYHRYVGGNFRIDALQAAILDIKLPHLDAWTRGRRRNAAVYNELLRGLPLELPRELPNRKHIFNQYVIRFRDGRDRVMQHLKSGGIGCEVYYPLTLPQQECFANLKQGSFPNSELAASQSLAIPVYPELTRAQIEEVVRAIRQALA